MIEDDKEVTDGGTEDDNSKNWYLGFLYFNPNDKRIFPPKRIKGLGWTINFANPSSVGAFAAILIALFFITRLIK